MKWWWVSYPIFVFMGIMMCSKFLLGEGGDYFQNVNAKKAQAELTQQKINLLNKKLEVLNKTDENVVREELKMILTAMPAKKEVQSLVNELNAAASGSGAQLISYQGNAGDVKEATESAIKKTTPEDVLRLDVKYKTDNFADIITILERLNKSLPLVKVMGVGYEKSIATMHIEGAWSAWEKVTGLAEDPLPIGYESIVSSVRAETAGYSNFIDPNQVVEINYSKNPF